MTEVKDAKAQLRAAKAARPWWKKKRVWALGAFGVIVIGAAAAPKKDKGEKVETAASAASATAVSTPAPQSSGAAAPEQTTRPATTKKPTAFEEVTPGDCETAYGTVKLKLTIENHSSKMSNYIIQAVAEVDGVKVADLMAYSSNVASGQKAIAEAGGLLPDDAKKSAVTCKVVDVTRTAAG